ncbi:MAG: hypothetical protein K2N78_07885 [Oscillospiraceae bacterium]|nr:hypothetical protein [Oscillospiraceae bacterium]
MKAVKFVLAGRERYLCFTVEAMFQIQDLCGGSNELMDLIQNNTREGFATTCKAVEILAEQGELVRRSMGYDPEPMVSAETISATTAPGDMAALKLAIPAAISLGYGREVEPENDEVDLCLAELSEQKKTK